MNKILDAYRDTHALAQAHNICEFIKDLAPIQSRNVQIWYSLYSRAPPEVFAKADNWKKNREELLALLPTEIEREMIRPGVENIALLHETEFKYRSQYKRIYDETDGSGHSFNYDISRGAEAVALDADNKYHPMVQQVIYGPMFQLVPDFIKSRVHGYLQSQREGIWVDQITSTENALLVAGAAHIDGEFGLKDRLLGKGITLNIVGPNLSLPENLLFEPIVTNEQK